MPILIHGTRDIPVMVTEVFVKCPSCEADQWADLLLFSVYVHLFWMPVFPTDKKATLICSHCGLKRHGLEPNDRLIPDYQLIKNKFRHPWYTWSGILLAMGILATIIITAAAE